MTNEQQRPYDRLPGEPALWYHRFERFRLMAPVRSIPKVYREEKQSQNAEKHRKTQKAQPENPDSTWYAMARLWRWEERAAAWDAELDAELEKEIAAERKKVLRSELALQHKRVELLNRKAKQLAEITDTEDQIWLLDVKSIGTGPDAERVDLVQFNDAAFKELREYLTDIADEMGERKKQDNSTIILLPKVYNGSDPDEDGIEP